MKDIDDGTKELEELRYDIDWLRRIRKNGIDIIEFTYQNHNISIKRRMINKLNFVEDSREVSLDNINELFSGELLYSVSKRANHIYLEGE